MDTDSSMMSSPPWKSQEKEKKKSVWRLQKLQGESKSTKKENWNRTHCRRGLWLWARFFLVQPWWTRPSWSSGEKKGKEEGTVMVWRDWNWLNKEEYMWNLLTTLMEIYNSTKRVSRFQVLLHSSSLFCFAFWVLSLFDWHQPPKGGHVSSTGQKMPRLPA